MLLFEFNDIDAALRYWQVVCELGLETAEERTELLLEFAKNGEMKRVQHTSRTKEQLLKDWGREHRILDLTVKKEQKDARPNNHDC